MRQATYERMRSSPMGGEQKLYRFPNGYGASVIRSKYSYGGGRGLWELAVIKYAGDGIDDFSIAYDTNITSDVIGGLGESDVDGLLAQIEAL